MQNPYLLFKKKNTNAKSIRDEDANNVNNRLSDLYWIYRECKSKKERSIELLFDYYIYLLVGYLKMLYKYLLNFEICVIMNSNESFSKS